MVVPVKESTRKHHDEKLLRAQLYIQNNLDGDLSLAAIARIAGVSPFHFHRMFKAGLGETVREYVDRLRVEKSFYDIRITDLTLLQIALRYGFKNAETYSRAFRRHFDHPPSGIQRERRPSRNNPTFRFAEHNFEAGLRCSRNTNFSVTRLATLHLAFIRFIGPYHNSPLVSDPGETLWRELERFAENKLGAKEPFIYLGIPQDDPETTDEEKQRFDSCLVVRSPFKPCGRIGYQRIDEGYYGVLTHAGPYSSLLEAYRRLFESAFGLKGFSIAANSVFELLMDISAASIEDHTWTELYVPLLPKGDF